jgi:stress-induced morphogen
LTPRTFELELNPQLAYANTEAELSKTGNTTMSTVATQALRRCLRRKSTIAACRGVGGQNITASSSARTCIAGAICPARTLSSTPLSPYSSRTTPPPDTARLTPRLQPTRIANSRRHSSSIQGTIGAGSAGIEEEAAREAEIISAPEHLNEKEKEIFAILQNALKPTKLEVQDISGGCGSMYGIEVLSERFKGLSMLRQQRLVNEVLKEEIGGWHGVQLKTGVP